MKNGICCKKHEQIKNTKSLPKCGVEVCKIGKGFGIHNKAWHYRTKKAHPAWTGFIISQVGAS